MTDVEVTALAINVTIPEALRWTDIRRGGVPAETSYAEVLTERIRC